MTPLQIQIKSLDLPEIARGAGVELTHRGGRHVGLCPFHDDHSPSFVIYDKRWWCHAENIGGDAVDLYQRLYGCNFKDACRMLGIQIGKPDRQTISEIRKAKLKSAERRAFQQRERELTYTIGTMIRRTRMALPLVRVTVPSKEAPPRFSTLI